MGELNLLEKYPKAVRDLKARAERRTPEDIAIARKFGQEFFDGERKHGYGGYYYNPKYWAGVVQDFIKHYRLKPGSRIMDIGCGKGFMLYDFKKVLPGLEVKGIDISAYAIGNALEEIKPFVSVGDARDLSLFKDKEFDLVISINTLHNLHLNECKRALREIQRIGNNAFIVNDAWRDEEEKKRMLNWNLTGITFMHVEEWKHLFEEVGYKGDYYWFVP